MEVLVKKILEKVAIVIRNLVIVVHKYGVKGMDINVISNIKVQT